MDILLIGCGAVGTVILKHLDRSEAIGQVTVADVNGALAHRIAASLQSSKVRSLRVDAGHAAALTEAMKGHDLVINASVPRFNAVIKGAALRSGLHYLDLSAESRDPYVDSEAWQEHGLTAIIGMGEDPGLSNVLARYAADRMDRVGSIRIRDGDTASSPEFSFIALFSPETFVQETLAPSRVWRDGTYEMVPPLGGKETYPFPPPLGRLTVYSVDHEEVDSLPRYIGKGVRYVDFKLALDDATVGTLQGLQGTGPAAGTPGDGAARRKAFLASVPKPADLVGRVDGYAALVVEVTGEERGERKRHVLHTLLGHREASRRFHATGTAYLTGTPAAVAATLLATGEIRQTGILAPELLDPDPILRMLRERGIEIHERVERGEGAPEDGESSVVAST